MSWLDRFLRRTPPPEPNVLSSPPPLQYTGLPRSSDDGPDAIAVGMALSELFSPGTWDQRRRVLEHRQKVLLTNNAIAALVQIALEARHTDPVQASFYLIYAELLDSSRRVGIPAAWRSFLPKVAEGYDLQPVDKLLTRTQGAWLLLVADPRAQRRFLEEHLELLSYGSLALLRLNIVQVQQVYAAGLSRAQHDALNDLWNVLFDIRRRGGDEQAVQDAYVNRFGGFVLNVPDWLEPLIERDLALRSQGRRDQTALVRLALWQHALERAQREPAGVEPEMLAEMHIQVKQAYNDARGLNKPQFQQEEIANLSFALKTYTEARYPYLWAMTQNFLGSVYEEYLQGNRAEYLEKAITCFRAALRVLTEQEFPVEWAKTQNYLGLAYRSRIQGNREENQEQAILFYQAALGVFTEQDTPGDWAMVQTNLGTLYLEHLHEQKVLNQRMAIACFLMALRAYTEQENPVEWATVQNNLGNVLNIYLEGNPVENRKQAISCYQAALRVRTEQEFPVEWATTQDNLGNVYSLQTGENSVEDSERAIACYQASLRVFTEQDFPSQWARSQHNLGHAYSQCLQENPTENSERAIACYQAALRVYTLQAFPELHRSTSLNLASCAAENRMWELAHTAFSSAREAEDDLVALAAGVQAVDTILREGDQSAAYDAYTLTRLGRYAEAAETVERGRARGLAAARLLNAADPQRISDPRRRETYVLQRTALLQAQAAVQQGANSSVASQERLTRAATLHQARA
ncbi:MAG: tetratricopeptide repeat protein, partial [Chloroflexota bacterium]|nr:tetratricopeptide repeat protein [Chloroflexota bacterium]